MVVSSLLRRKFSLWKGVSPIYISIDKKYLSQQYGLTDLKVEYWVYGTILDVSRLGGPLSDDERRVVEEHVIGKDVKLYLIPAFLTYYDSLYFDENSWVILRDAGIFPDEYKVKVRLTKVEIRESGKLAKEVELYPYRNIEVQG